MRLDTKSIQKGGRKLWFYIANFSLYYTPTFLIKWWLAREAKSLTPEEKDMAQRRAAFYARLPQGATLGADSVELRNYKYPFGQRKKFSAYFFDLLLPLRYFWGELRMHYLFGDIRHTLDKPTLVKSRPIVEGPTQSVLCKLDKTRHFLFVKDKHSFREKQNRIVFRNIVNHQPWRTLLLEKYHTHPLCDLGFINKDSDAPAECLKPFMSIDEQLTYKIICCIEGHDVATNLKWVMSSNSLAIMPKPIVESWFMESLLIPNYHYVEVKPDYSDFIEKATYYMEHPEEAEEIIRNAQAYVAQFLNPRLERYTAVLTLQRYFEQTAQMRS